MVDLLRTEPLPQDEGSGLAPALRRPRRSRRSVFLHSGVRICPQESVEEVLSNHQAYYQLRGTYHHLAAVKGTFWPPGVSTGFPEGQTHWDG